MTSKEFYRFIKEQLEKKQSIDELMSIFKVNTFEELMNDIYNCFVEALDEFGQSHSFETDYHNFLYNLTEQISDGSLLDILVANIYKNINHIKDLIKPYNKNEKAPDELLTIYRRYKCDLTSNLDFTLSKQTANHEDDTIKVLKKFIFEIKDLDVLFNIITRHKKLATVYYNDEPFLFYIIRYFFDNIDTMSLEDIDYYKRVITMFIVSDELSLDFKEVDSIIKEIDYRLQKTSSGTPQNQAMKYVRAIIDKYNKNDIPNNYNCELWVPKTSKLERIDLRHIPAVTIDFLNRPRGFKVLYDDAFSFEECEDGTYFLYIHVPDVDQYIMDNKELEEHMQRVSESRYLKVMPMIPYPIATKMSLIQNRDTACLTFRLNVNRDGKVIKVDFFKSYVNVCDNLSRTRADNIFKDPTNPLVPLLEKMYSVASLLRKSRGEAQGKRTKAGVIMDEYNIWANLATAEFFNDEGFVFPYRNCVEKDYKDKYIEEMLKFKSELSSYPVEHILTDINTTKPRQFYSTTNYGNSNFNGRPYGNVGNPLREYMSLESGRLIKSIIDGTYDPDYWQETLDNDCIEHTEIRAKVNQLYKTTK